MNNLETLIILNDLKNINTTQASYIILAVIIGTLLMLWIYRSLFKKSRYAEYRKFLKTKEWKDKSKEIKKLYGNKCVLCDATVRLEVHKLNYSLDWLDTKNLLCVCAVCHGTGYTDEIESEDFASVILAPEPRTGPMQQALMTNYLMRKAMLEEELKYLQQEVRGGRMTKKQMAYRLMELDNRLRAEEEPQKKRGTITYMKGVKVKPRKLNGDPPPETAMKRTHIGRKDPEPLDVEWDSDTEPYQHDPFNEVDWEAEQIERGRKHKVGRQVVEECVDIRGSKADETANYYRVRFRDPKSFSNFRVPEWASRAANTIGRKYYDVRGSKITMGQDTQGSWSIQSVMIPRNNYVSPEDALRIANHIQDRLEREGKWAKKECKDKERVLVIR